MHFIDFQSGSFRQQYQYRNFSPARINHGWTWDDPAIHTLLEEATRWLGELNAFSRFLPDVDLHIRMHVLKEANASSRIEGTQTRMETAVKDFSLVEPEKRDDWEEVHNYIDALNFALRELESLPLSGRLLCETHRSLMRGVRGEHKNPGELRRSQNWIGGSSLKDAAFVPPAHEEVGELMSDLEKFWHNGGIEVPHLVRNAISHYQFETIHPFLDGNGRIGRLLITLYLVSHGLLAKPCLYVSSFFEQHRGAYYDALTRVRTGNDLNHWVRFFLSGIRDTARGATETFRTIAALKDRLQRQVMTLGRKSENALRLLEALYGSPIGTVGIYQQKLDLSARTANQLVAEFVRLGILKETTGYRRNREFLFEEYFALFIE